MEDESELVLEQVGEKRSLPLDMGEEPSRKRKKGEISFSFFPAFDPETSYVAGIDEAGRGPVLGHMVYAIAFYPLDDQDRKLRAIGFNDSKQLTEVQRDTLFEKIHQKEVGFVADPLSAEGLSSDMLRINRRNLNQISFDSAMGLVSQVLRAGVKIRSLFVDTVGKPEKYEEMLRREFPGIPSIKVSKKADSIYPIVGAASICAKVIRDRLLKECHFAAGSDISRVFGSGYPGDQVTKDWMAKNKQHVFGYPSLVRYSWSTTVNSLADCAPVHWSYEDLQAYEESNNRTRTPIDQQSALQASNNRAKAFKLQTTLLQKRTRFFSSCGAQRVTSGL